MYQNDETTRLQNGMNDVLSREGMYNGLFFLRQGLGIDRYLLLETESILFLISC